MKLLTALGIFAILSSCSEQNDGSGQSLPFAKIDDVISYMQHEYHHESRQTNGTLLVLVYDIPYFSGCGVFPPLHIVNQIFESGGGDGGMSPGASWSPFQIDSNSYSSLIEMNQNTDLLTLKGRARYTNIKYIEDRAFDSIEDQFDWAEAACNKHRDWYISQSTNDSGV